MDKEPIPLLPRWSTLLFLRRFIAQPGQIGSVAPSSHFLVQEMLKLTDWPAVTDVAELGAGTGVVTEALLRKISPDACLSVFELDRKLREKIESRFKIAVFSDACDLAQVIRPRSLDVIISSLPWTTLPREVSGKILQGVVACLKPSGQFIAYQYSRQMHRLSNRSESRSCSATSRRRSSTIATRRKTAPRKRRRFFSRTGSVNAIIFRNDRSCPTVRCSAILCARLAPAAHNSKNRFSGRTNASHSPGFSEPRQNERFEIPPEIIHVRRSKIY